MSIGTSGFDTREDTILCTKEDIGEHESVHKKLVVGVAVSARPAGLIWAWYAPTLHYPGEGIR